MPASALGKAIAMGIALAGSTVDDEIPGDVVKKLGDTIPGAPAVFVVLNRVSEDNVPSEIEPCKPS
jgi:uncharacterized membrane protein